MKGVSKNLISNTSRKLFSHKTQELKIPMLLKEDTVVSIFE